MGNYDSKTKRNSVTAIRGFGMYGYCFSWTVQLLGNSVFEPIVLYVVTNSKTNTKLKTFLVVEKLIM